MTREDGLERIQDVLNSDLLRTCDKLILPPIYELVALYGTSELQTIKSKILPLRTNYVKSYVLPYSIVGKIACIGFRSHWEHIGEYRNNLIIDHIYSANQIKNKHFQKSFPLYKIVTNHWSVLYDLPRSRFVNKLIKIDLKKLKDYAVDTLISLEYGYFKYQKTILDTFHKTVRFHTMDKMETIISGQIKDNQTQYGICVFYTGESEQLQENKTLMWWLNKGESVDIKLEKTIL